MPGLAPTMRESQPIAPKITTDSATRQNFHRGVRLHDELGWQCMRTHRSVWFRLLDHFDMDEPPLGISWHQSE
jgi:hypothetical protein